jgi:uncharacterized protein involved in exopolysaccharide biosynthesis
MTINNNLEEATNKQNEEMSIKELIISIKKWIIFLKSKLKFIFIFAILGGLFAASFGIFEKQKYKAVFTFAMEEDKGGGGLSGALGLASSFGIDLGTSAGGAFSNSNLLELIKSQLIIEKALLRPVIINNKKTTLAEYYIEFNKLRDIWKDNPSVNKINFTPETERNFVSLQKDSLLKTIYKELLDNQTLSAIQKDKKISILTIEVQSTNEIFAKLFCESLADETSNFYIQTKTKKAKANRDILQKQVDSVRNELNSAITGVSSEADNNYNLNPAYNRKIIGSKKKQIDVQANTSILTNLVVQLELSKITLQKETPLIQEIDRPKLPLDNEKPNLLKAFVIGAFLSSFLIIIYFIFKEALSKILIS